jgi:anti-sigma factor RsiW
MNCRRIEELIPLYVSGDVDRRLSGEVQSHLKTCGGCAELAAQYEASRNWLSGAPPEFDEARLADVKRGIMREIENAKPQAGLFELMSEPIARTLLRPAVAAGLLLVVFGALTFWLYAERQGSKPPTQAVVTEDKDASEQVARDSHRDATPSAKKQPQHTGMNHHTRAAGVSSNRRPRSIGVTEEQVITQIAEAKNEAQSPSAVDSDGMLRIEIQTVDPNIRIIWFAPREIGNQHTNP